MLFIVKTHYALSKLFLGVPPAELRSGYALQVLARSSLWAFCCYPSRGGGGIMEL